MGQPTWKVIAEDVKVPGKPCYRWTQALDYLTPGRLYRIQVKPEISPEASGKAEPETASTASPDATQGAEPAPAPSAQGVPAQQVPPTKPKEEGGPPEQDQRWQPESDSDSKTGCSADGDPGIVRKNGVCPMPDVNVGALIARIGGSTADAGGDKDKTALFSVGRHCVFLAPETPRVGSLFLGVNDTATNAVNLKGQLKVSIDEAL